MWDLRLIISAVNASSVSRHYSWLTCDIFLHLQDPYSLFLLLMMFGRSYIFGHCQYSILSVQTASDLCMQSRSHCLFVLFHNLHSCISLLVEVLSQFHTNSIKNSVRPCWGGLVVFFSVRQLVRFLYNRITHGKII